MNDGREFFALKKFIGIMSDCRRQIVEDVLSGNPELFRFLFEDKNKCHSSAKQNCLTAKLRRQNVHELAKNFKTRLRLNHRQAA